MKVDQDFIDGIERLLRDRLGSAGLKVKSAGQIAGAGLSRSVVRVTTLSEGREEQSFILLIADAASPVLPNRRAEYAALRALSAYPAVKVPRTYCLEEGGDVVGHPFIVTDLLPGTTNPRDLVKEAYLPHARRITQQGFEVLGSLAAIDAHAIDLGPSIAVPTPANVHRLALERMEQLLRDNEASGMPIACAALRHLHRTMPAAPDKISIVHGDYRIGNYLFDASGITGVIDWEMVHKGDPLEDLAWAMLPNWQFAARPGLIAGFLTREEVIQAWESASGLKVDGAALDWWILFSHIKALSIWVTSRHMFSSGKTRELVMGLVGYDQAERQEAYMAKVLVEQWT